MKAIVRREYGSPDVLELRDIEQPVAGAGCLQRLGEHVVRVQAGVDKGVWHVVAGLPYLIRLAGYGLRAPKNAGSGG